MRYRVPDMELETREDYVMEGGGQNWHTYYLYPSYKTAVMLSKSKESHDFSRGGMSMKIYFLVDVNVFFFEYQLSGRFTDFLNVSKKPSTNLTYSHSLDVYYSM